MDPVLSDFFRAGRALRQHRSFGDFIVVEKGGVFAETLVRWVRGHGREVVCFPSLIEALSAMRVRTPRCIIIDSDGQETDSVERILLWIDRMMLEVVGVVCSSYRDRSQRFQELSPRVTVINKGEGLESFIQELDSQIHANAIPA